MTCAITNDVMKVQVVECRKNLFNMQQSEEQSFPDNIQIGQANQSLETKLPFTDLLTLKGQSVCLVGDPHSIVAFKMSVSQSAI